MTDYLSQMHAVAALVIRADGQCLLRLVVFDVAVYSISFPSVLLGGTVFDSVVLANTGHYVIMRVGINHTANSSFRL